MQWKSTDMEAYSSGYATAFFAELPMAGRARSNGKS
jgi:hypothetical protein